MRATHSSNLIIGRNKPMRNNLYLCSLSEEMGQSRAVAHNEYNCAGSRNRKVVSGLGMELRWSLCQGPSSDFRKSSDFLRARPLHL